MFMALGNFFGLDKNMALFYQKIRNKEIIYIKNGYASLNTMNKSESSIIIACRYTRQLFFEMLT